MQTTLKVVAAGSIIEIYWYTNSVNYGVRLDGKEKKEKVREVRDDDEAILRSGRYAKKMVRRWIDANAWQWPDQYGNPCVPKFATFTFRENITSLPTANYFFSKFIKRFNYALGFKKSFLKYIVIREFQQRGAVHYHCLFFNLPFVDDLQKIMETSWQHGFVQVKAVDRVKNLSLYLTKYMTKGMLDTTWKGKRRYFVSRGLLRPIDIREESIGRSIIRTLDGPAMEHKTWHSDYAGAIEYMKFDLGKGRSVFDLPLDSETKAVLDAYKQSLQA